MVAEGAVTKRLIAGIVTRVAPPKDEKQRGGVQLDDVDYWYNISQFAKGEIKLPEKGQAVVLTVGNDKWIQAIELTELPPQQPKSFGPPEQALVVAGPPESTGPGRDRLIVRQTAVKAAVELLATRNTGPLSITARDVLSMAADFEKWIYRVDPKEEEAE